MANENVFNPLAVFNSSQLSNSIVLFGDSITANNNNGNGLAAPNNILYQSQLIDYGYFTWTNIWLNNAFKVLHNAGIPGNTSTQCVARMQSDVLAYSPQWVSLMIGINDVVQNVPTTTVIANIKSMVNTLLGAGIKVILWQLFPNSTVSSTGSQMQKYAISTINAAIKAMADANQGVVLMDAFNPVYDNTTPCAYVSGGSGDGTHPTFYAANFVGYQAAQKILPFVKPSKVTASNADAATIGTVGTAATAAATSGSNVINFTAGTIVPYVGMYLGFSDGVATFPLGTYVTAVNLTTQIVVSNYAIKATSGLTMSGFNPYGNLITNPVMQGTGGATAGSTVFTSTPPASWYFAGSGDSVNCAATFSQLARIDNVGGKMWRSVVTWTTSQAGVATFTHRLLTAPPLPVGVNAGDIVDVEWEVHYHNSDLSDTNPVNAGALELHITPRDASHATLTPDASFQYSGATNQTPWFNGVIGIRGLVIPANTYELLPQITCRNLAGTNGGYTLDLGNIVVRKRVTV